MRSVPELAGPPRSAPGGRFRLERITVPGTVAVRGRPSASESVDLADSGALAAHDSLQEGDPTLGFRRRAVHQFQV